MADLTKKSLTEIVSLIKKKEIKSDRAAIVQKILLKKYLLR